MSFMVFIAEGVCIVARYVLQHHALVRTAKSGFHTEGGGGWNIPPLQRMVFSMVCGQTIGMLLEIFSKIVRSKNQNFPGGHVPRPPPPQVARTLIYNYFFPSPPAKNPI